MSEPRVISLVPSVTETLSAWGVTPIACTKFCERPDLVHVGGTKNPDIEKIVELRPTLVVVDAEENRREDYDALLAKGIEVHVLRVRSLEDINSSMLSLANRVGAQWETLALPRAALLRATAFIPIWRRPWMALGQPTYGASLLAHLGVVSVFTFDGPYPQVELDEVARRKPSIVLVPSEPYGFKASHLVELEEVAPTMLVDGKDLFWWGARTRGALQRLAAALQDR